MIDNIKNLVQNKIKFGNKQKYIKVVADEFNQQPSSIKQNWFYTWSIPKEKLERLLEITQNFIKNQ